MLVITLAAVTCLYGFSTVSLQLPHSTNCIFYVVKVDGAHKMLIRDSIDALHHLNANISGCIVNGIPRHQSPYYHNYGYSKKYGKSAK